MPETAPLRIGIIGAGGRGVGGYVRYFQDAPRPVELIAIADPDPLNARSCQQLVAGRQSSEPALFSNWHEMLERETAFDGMIIATPNHLHFEPAMACLKAGVKAIALEKPLANRPENCASILRESEARGAAVQLGFVLRSTPFYRKVKELLAQGTVGRIVSVQADELVSPRVSSVNFRGPWRRYTSLSGGALLEKCCHDMDILNWLIGANPSQLSSFGGQSIYGPNSGLPDRCDHNCPLHKNCLYYCQLDQMSGFRGNKKVEAVCVFNSGADIVDHQSVQIHYENNTVCNFMLNFNVAGERGSRNLHIIGTRGRIWGNLEDAVVNSHDLSRDRLTVHRLDKDSSGHGGGDRTHALEFVQLASGDSMKPIASAYDAYLSAMMCFAADRSRLERRQVSIRYPAAGQVEIT